MRVARWIAIALAFGLMLYMCALPGDLPAAVDSGDGLAGTYTANGLHPNGTEFGGTAVFVATDDPDVFDYQLIITGSIQLGMAEVRGDRIDVTWETVSSASDETITGTGDYLIKADGTITGSWRVDDSAGGTDVGAADAEGSIELFPEP